jgi:cyclopropane fatty-acyl-phospholipid synthase-like methyltransferase
MLKKLIRKGIINNRFINPFLAFLRLDAVLNDYNNDYPDYQPEAGKSLQEIAGYSASPEMNEVMARLRALLSAIVREHAIPGSRILDVGCGPGLFLSQFKKDYELWGIDISAGMCTIARRELPEAEIINDGFLKHHFTSRFRIVYTVGVLIYFSRSQIRPFFRKVHDLLESGGIAIISYPHAFRKKDMYYHDFTYVHYSPLFLESLVSGDFEILYHRHQDGHRRVTDYDRDPVIGKGYDGRSYSNSSVLVIRKK